MHVHVCSNLKLAWNSIQAEKKHAVHETDKLFAGEKKIKQQSSCCFFIDTSHWICLCYNMCKWDFLHLKSWKIKLLRLHICFLSTKSVGCLLVKGRRLDMLFIWPHTRHIRFRDMESFWTGGEKKTDKPFTPLPICTSCKTHLILNTFV